MAQLTEIKVPDIGDFKDVAVIEVLVKPGDTVEKETSLITLETDKASIEVPSPQSGIVKELKVKVGDKVSEGSIILMLEATTAEAAAPAKASEPGGASKQEEPAEKPAANVAPPSEKEEEEKTPASVAAPAPESVAPPAAPSIPQGDIHADIVVLGAGPGGYTAAFRAADLGKNVVLIERYSTLGGVCLNVGCIPSKALLHVAKVITDAEETAQQGIAFAKPGIEIDKLRGWKESIIGKLTKGLTGLAKQRKVKVVRGTGRFTSPNMIEVETSDGKKTVSFEHCIIAAGSAAARIPGFPYDDPRIIDSTGALKLESIPKRMLIIGGGIIGLEMATVYDALGSRISVVELMDQLIPGADADLIRPLHKRIQKRYEAIYLKTKVTRIEALQEGLRVTFEGSSEGGGPEGTGAPEPQVYDRILMAVGRRPNGREIGAEKAGIAVNERGFIPVDKQLRTNVSHIFAIGDIAGEPMLAHKASHEGKLAAEIIAGGEKMKSAAFDARAIPSVAYTDPEIAWMGLTETEAKKQGIEIEKAVFPWAVSGRALAMARDEGMTKLILDKKTRRILGAGIVGINAGELISETVLGLEMGADMEDIGLTIHPHPTLSETVFFAAEIAEGTITDLYMPKK
ncbi:dihydrolipoamide dehydrogenase [Nitrosospira multiformis ATCC 25196]|uniref:Dihydrolipoyl dehydrogenase n=1 Tax=Nitrosospira multiformis (strain ATCC 25196 / NCIMB 11849 / C 71) TaxID=323848 RepID=Q2YBP8_NITMU|nr:dihydrolipoyl dehydrogenase [Nitrosospira multiformis]ABB73823.1 dihydrolipoamide dehydrogenase [Nitrosospira multiformis ATCC 25196]SEF42770.1 dihydrolipoamide dehydrogenase [Nitrosospira multiformis ATCC 25196]